MEIDLGEIVEEWLRRQGYFTMRSVKMEAGVLDVIAVARQEVGPVECRHFAVQKQHSSNVSLTSIPVASALKRIGVASDALSAGDVEAAVKEWIKRTFQAPSLIALRQMLWDGPWSSELVVVDMLPSRLLNALRRLGVRIHQLDELLRQLQKESSLTSSGAQAVENATTHWKKHQIH